MVLVGVVFGVTLSWTGLSSPEVLREGLLLDNAYLYLFFASAVATSTRRAVRCCAAPVRAPLLTGEPVAWAREPPRRRHVVGSLTFGVGWAVADACPGPIATQVGQGVLWSLFTITGVVVGMVLAQRVGDSAGERAGGEHVDALGSGGRRRDAAPGAQAA